MRLLTRLRESPASLLPLCLPRRITRRSLTAALSWIISTRQHRGGKSTLLCSRSQRFQQNQRHPRHRECLEFPEDPEPTSSGAMVQPRWARLTLRGKFSVSVQPRKSQSNPWSVSKEDAIMRTSQDDWNKTNMFLFLINIISFVVFTCIISSV